MITDVRARAREVLEVVPPLGHEITSDGATADLFTELTGTTHATLRKSRAGGGHLTTCNAFVGWYARALGAREYLGRFDLDTQLSSWGKGYAWVHATPGRRPRYGDIVRFRAFHIGVSLDFDSLMWNSVESGPGGSTARRAVIKRKRTLYHEGAIAGWLDVARYFGGPEAERDLGDPAALPWPDAPLPPGETLRPRRW